MKTASEELMKTTAPSTLDPRPDSLDLSPRTIVRWDTGRPEIFEDVSPTPFDSVRAEEIIDATRATGYCASPWNSMTNGEIAYICALWDTIPDGRSCWMTAFNAIRRG
jgi:hypothetical protein